MSERERRTPDERSDEQRWHDADLASRQVVDLSAMRSDGATLLVNRDERGDRSNGVLISADNRLLGLFINGQIVEPQRFNRTQFDQFMHDNKDLALALDVRRCTSTDQNA